MRRRLLPVFSAERRLKGYVSVFCSVKQVFVVKLKAERRGKKATYRGRLSG
jgi:hypothetical protein